MTETFTVTLYDQTIEVEAKIKPDGTAKLTWSLSKACEVGNRAVGKAAHRKWAKRRKALRSMSPVDRPSGDGQGDELLLSGQ